MKILSIALISLLTVPVLASEITSPFYLPQTGHFLTKTDATYNKDKFKVDTTSRRYQRTLGEKIMLGIGGGMAVLIGGDLNWTKQKEQLTFSHPHTKTYAAGLKGQWETMGILTQISTLYRQTTNVFFEPRRQMETHIRLGKNLKFMIPYLHLKGQFPLNARPQFDEPIYRAETGVFQNVNDKITLDSALYLAYDKNIHGKSYGLRTELSYLLSSWSSIGINGEWQAKGHAKNGADTYHQSVGINMRFAF